MLLSMQRDFIFFPEKLSLDFKYQFNSAFEEVTFYPEANIEINALWFKRHKSNGVILFFHGNAGSLSSWGHIGDLLSIYPYDVLIFDYRGYGKSTGEITEQNMFSDSEFIYKELLKTYSEGKIILYGRSIGSAPASFLVSKFNPKALILEAPFYNFIELVKNHFPIVPGFALQFKFENNLYLKKYSGPIYIIHGTDDEVVPLMQSEKLVKSLTTVKSFIRVPGGHHSDLEDTREHLEFLKNILSS